MNRDLVAALSVALVVVGMVGIERYLNSTEKGIVLLILLAVSLSVAALAPRRRKEAFPAEAARRRGIVRTVVLLVLASLAMAGAATTMRQAGANWSVGRIAMGVAAILTAILGWALVHK